MAASLGNKYAQKWDLDAAIIEFEKAHEDALSNDDCLSLYTAVRVTEMPYSTYDYLAQKHEVLGRLKKDSMRLIIERINAMALRNKYNTVASIYRMKQLGEQDVQHNENTNTHKFNIIDLGKGTPLDETTTETE